MLISWNNHLENLSTVFPDMFSQQKFVDVTLACEGRRIHCHRVVLAASSSYFDVLLAENPCQHPIIILPRDVKFWAVDALVEFMYKGEVSVSENCLEDFMKCAEILEIRGIRRNFREDQNITAEIIPEPEFVSAIKTEPTEVLEQHDFHITHVSGGSGASGTDILSQSPEIPVEPSTSRKYLPKKSVDVSELCEQSMMASSPPKTPGASLKSLKVRKDLERIKKRKFEEKMKKKILRAKFESVLFDFTDNEDEEFDDAIPPGSFQIPPKSTYSREEMWAAMMSVQGGMSIVEASKSHNVPAGSLFALIRKYDIKPILPKGARGRGERSSGFLKI
ncbi:hypothetical protein DMENIID0001_135900 [Sergentomyia squamirostris]